MSVLTKYPDAVLRRMFEKLDDQELAIWGHLLTTAELASELMSLAKSNERSIAELEAVTHALSGGKQQ
jgi:hypothetical protein